MEFIEVLRDVDKFVGLLAKQQHSDKIRLYSTT